jgi:hypothetical protein
LLDGAEHHAVALAEDGRCVHSVPQLFNQFLLVTDRRLAPLACTVDGQRLFERGEDVGVVHNHATVLARKYTIRPRNSLHERMIAHRPVEIHSGTTRCVKARQPHCAKKHETQRIFWVFELLIQSLSVHPLSMRDDV